MAKRKRKKSYAKRKTHRKNPKRVRAAKRAYKKSGLYLYNLKKKRKGGKKKYAKKRKTHRAKKHHVKKTHRKYKKRKVRKVRRKHYKRLSKTEARAARIARKLVKAHRKAEVKAAAAPSLSSHQRKNLARLRAKAEAAKSHVPAYWAS